MIQHYNGKILVFVCQPHQLLLAAEQLRKYIIKRNRILASEQLSVVYSAF